MSTRSSPAAPRPLREGVVEPEAVARLRTGSGSVKRPPAHVTADAGKPLDPGPEATVEFLVVGPDGAPDAGALIRLAPPRDGRSGVEYPETVTESADDKGRAWIDVPSNWPSTGLAAGATSADGQRGANSVSCSVGAICTLRLVPVAVVQGHVVGLVGAEHEHVRVRAYSPVWPEAPGGRAFRVDETGGFTVSGADRYLALVATAPGRVPSVNWSTTLPRDAPDVVELHLGAKGVDAVVVLELSSGEAAPPGTRVLVSSGRRGWIPTATGARGETVLPNVDPQTETRLMVWPRQDPAGRWLTVRAEFTLSPSELMSRPRLVVHEAMSARFRIRDSAGQPVSGLRVAVRRDAEAFSHYVATDEQGLADPFLKSSDRAGSYTLLRDTGEPAWRGSLTVADTEVQVTVDDAWFDVSLRDGEGRLVSGPNIGVGVVYGGSPLPIGPLYVTPPGFQTFEPGVASVRLFVKRELRGSARVRVICKAWGAEDHALGTGGTLQVLRPPRDTATLSLRLGAVPDASARARLHLFGPRESLPGASLRLRFPVGSDGTAWAWGLPQGTYDWHVDVADEVVAQGRDVWLAPWRVTEISGP
jgi:hypothetical protein